MGVGHFAFVIWARSPVVGGQWVAELAWAQDYLPSHFPSLVVGIRRCVYPVFVVLVALVNVGDVAVASCWLRGGWSAGAG